jgi:hypothetical protein
LCTTDELYISAPYFTPEESLLIKNTVVSPPILTDIPEFEALEFDEDINSGTNEPPKEVAPEKTLTIEEATTSCLQNFFAKRRASGDARPCGPHDMGPIYKAVFGITTEELKDEKFLGRLRRTGLGQSNDKTANYEVKGKRKKKGSKVDYVSIDVRFFFVRPASSFDQTQDGISTIITSSVNFGPVVKAKVTQEACLRFTDPDSRVVRPSPTVPKPATTYMMGIAGKGGCMHIIRRAAVWKSGPMTAMPS